MEVCSVMSKGLDRWERESTSSCSAVQRTDKAIQHDGEEDTSYRRTDCDDDNGSFICVTGIVSAICGPRVVGDGRHGKE